MLKKIPLYTLFFATFPVLSLAAHNIQEIAPGDFVRPLLASLLLGLLVFGLTRLLLRNWDRAGLLALLVLLLFFTYGQVYNVLEDITLTDISLFRHRTLLPLWLLFLLAGGCWIACRIRLSERSVYWLNLFTIFLVVYPVFTITLAIVKQEVAERGFQEQELAVKETEFAKNPDIYYIILDSYGRADVLQDIGYDNSEFLSALRQRGFYVADCSQANYPYTRYSLTSSLNYNYLEAIGATNYNKLIRLLNHSAVRSFLEARGYQTVAFSTGNAWDEWRDAAFFMDISSPVTELSDFEWLVIDGTLLRAWSDYKHQNNTNAPVDTKTGELRRKRTMNVFSNLVKLPEWDGDLFVFAHINAPHQPYLFGPDGEFIDFNANNASEKELAEAYVGQLRFVNRETLRVVDSILAKSKTPPIIIIQGDHGPQEEISLGYARRMPILNAYYLPGINSEQILYPSISPVNTYRVILNTYFEQNLPMLEDLSYFSPSLKETEFELVPNSCPGTP